MVYKLEVSVENLQILSAALGKLPFEAVAGLISDLQKQVNEQEKLAQTPVEP